MSSKNKVPWQKYMKPYLHSSCFSISVWFLCKWKYQAKIDKNKFSILVDLILQECTKSTNEFLQYRIIFAKKVYLFLFLESIQKYFFCGKSRRFQYAFYKSSSDWYFSPKFSFAFVWNFSTCFHSTSHRSLFLPRRTLKQKLKGFSISAPSKYAT